MPAVLKNRLTTENDILRTLKESLTTKFLLLGANAPINFPTPLSLVFFFCVSSDCPEAKLHLSMIFFLDSHAL